MEVGRRGGKGEEALRWGTRRCSAPGSSPSLELQRGLSCWAQGFQVAVGGSGASLQPSSPHTQLPLALLEEGCVQERACRGERTGGGRPAQRVGRAEPRSLFGHTPFVKTLQTKEECSLE